MAEVIRALLDDPSANPQMMVEPLELLVEIGVEYLKNSYIAVFVQSGIAKEDVLNVPQFSRYCNLFIHSFKKNITIMSIFCVTYDTST